MAETLISPGVLARENDQSFIQGQPVEAGAAVVGPAAKGPVGIPTLVTSFSEYRAIFGGAITSGSSEYTYLTSISANNYFSQGGKSLLVTRVAKGNFTDATSTDLYNSVETGDLALKALSVTGGVGGVATTYSNVPLTASNGTEGIITIVKGLAAGKLDTTVDSLLGSISQQSTGVAASTYANVATTTNGAGSGAVLTLVADGTVSSVTVTTQGSGYAVGDELVVTGSAIGSSTDIKFIFVADDIVVEVESATITTAGSGYIVGETISVGSAELGGGTDVSYTLTAGDIVNQVPFVLSTLSEGVIMNSSGSEVGNGALSLGTQDNIRWEIVSSNVNSGTFSLLVRSGNDTNRNKSILETWTNLSLDPKAPNYLEKVIGNTSYSIVVDGVDSYVQSQGEYINKSKYLRVSAVTAKTPDYFDNAGNAKSAYTSSLPFVGSGSFSGAEGALFGAGAKFYDQITAADIQGLSPSDYTSSITLLNNKDDYKFNLLTAPGLNSSDHSTPVNLLVTTAEARQDCIAVVDLDGYGTGIGTVINNAASFDSSYAATYFPWLQTLDPNTGQAVFVPASTLIPGVYAFTDASSDAWFAPAGLTRGALGNVTKAERKLTTTNRDSLYEANVNPIATFPGNGVVVFGQKTLQKRASALDRVNVRRLLIALKGYISQVSDNLVFEQNTIATRNTFLAQVNPYLESVQQRQGLYAFKVVMDDTNNTPDVIDRNQLVGQIYLQPTRTAEFIMLDFNVLPTGAVFPE
ncbi:phage tail sheath subtilisin-like domain-containing protein [Gammaproteobacteria bacterium]|nr:phage tail sheath subtilisin-like domain-containing protein [Gammaproteobacteria bacterium]